jgi:hypothetical protein
LARKLETASDPHFVALSESLAAGDLLEQRLRDPAAVLRALLEIQAVDDVPEPVLPARGDCGTKPLLRVGADEGEAVETIRSFPVRTYSSTRIGSVPRAHSAQYGHWRSAYSTSVTGAFGSPSAAPDCGIPAKELCGTAAGRVSATPEPMRLAAIRAAERTTTAATSSVGCRL